LTWIGGRQWQHDDLAVGHVRRERFGGEPIPHKVPNASAAVFAQHTPAFGDSTVDVHCACDKFGTSAASSRTRLLVSAPMSGFLSTSSVMCVRGSCGQLDRLAGAG
jgi:hypothetical protein